MKRKKLVAAAAAALLFAAAGAAVFFFQPWQFLPWGGSHDEHTEESAPSGADDHEPSSAAHAANPLLGRTSAIIAKVDAILHLQAAMAAGDASAPEALKQSMRALSKDLRDTAGRNYASLELRAIALFVLSGGDPATAARLGKTEGIDEDDGKLLRGAAAFSRASKKEAANELLDLDVENFDPMLAAQVRLAQAELQAPTDAAKSLQLLKQAAMSAPGTLIEEAATRRILRRLSEGHASRTFADWVERYLRRFKSSLYAGEFEASFARAAEAWDSSWYMGDPDILRNVLTASDLPRARTMERRLIIGAMRTGDVAACRHIRQSHEEVFGAGSFDDASVAALWTVCTLAEGEASTLALLRDIDRNRLDSGAKYHVERALRLAEALFTPPESEVTAFVGPLLPISADKDFAGLDARAAQLRKDNLALLKDAGINETDPQGKSGN